MSTYKSTYKKNHEIYEKHRRNYRENGDSKQMCCMWSTNDPPGVIENTEPFNDIEAAFNIALDEDEYEALDLYNMDLKDAAKGLLNYKKKNDNKATQVLPSRYVIRATRSLLSRRKE